MIYVVSPGRWVMRQLSLPQSALVQAGIGLVVSLLAAGCATSSDLQKLNLDLAQKLDAQTKTLRAETSSLRDQAKSFKTELESLRAQVGTFQFETRTALERLNEQEVMRQQILNELTASAANTKKTMEGYGATSLERFGKIETMTRETAKQLQTVQQSVSGFSGRIEQLPSLVTTLGTEVRSLTATLLGSYELEEAALKDRLRAVEDMKKRLRPLEARQ
jgi:archaellum component FlaC